MVSDTPRDQGPDPASSDRAPRLGAHESAADSVEPTTGPPAGAADPADGPPGEPADPGDAAAGSSGRTGAAGFAGRTGGRAGGSRWRAAFAPASAPDPQSAAGQRQRRRQRLFVAGIAVAAVAVVVALCAGALSVVSAVHQMRDRNDSARANRQLRVAACLELEQRLNRLGPPGAATTPQARAAAVQNENAAVRIYVGENRSQREQEWWRQLLDARTAYAEALAQQAKTRTPAFYVTPRTGDGRAVTDQLVDSAPASCAGAIRRLATPDL